MFLDPTAIMTALAFANPLLATDASTVGGLLDLAGQLFTWLITQMTALVSFITDNPIILIGMIIGLAGLVVGMFMRIWHSAG